MSTSFNFPLNPTLNQVVVLPDGNSAQWNGYAWISVGDNVTYPLAIPKGGTGATNPDTALSNLGGGVPIGIPIFKSTTAAAARAILGLDGTIPWVLQDGTVAAPGLAWNSEPGLGLFRPSASLIGFVAQGAYLAYLSGSAANSTSFVVSPRTAGQGAITVINQPNGSANFNALNFNATSSGLNIATSKAGAAGAMNLYITNGDAGIYARTPNFEISNASGGTGAGYAQLFLNKGTGANDVSIIYGSKNGVPRWNLQLGTGVAETGSNVGSDFALDRLSDTGAYVGTPLAINRSTGTVTVQNLLNVGGAIAVNGGLTVNTGNLTVSGGTLTVSGGAAFGGQVGATVFNASNNIVAPIYYIKDANTYLQKDASSNIIFQMAPSWYWVYEAASGMLSWRRNNGVADTIIHQSGSLINPGNIWSGADGVFGLVSSDPNLKYIRFSANNWRLQHIVANGSLAYVSFAGTTLWNLDGNGAMNTASGINSGAWLVAATNLVVGTTASITGISDLVGGIKCRLGTGGQAGGNVYNWFWNGPSDPHLYAGVDATNQGWATLNVSDERAKQSVKTLESDTAAFMALRPISFRWNWPLRDPKPVQAGFSAQNVARVLPQALVGDIDSPVEEDGSINMPASVDTTVILAHTVAMVQNLHKRLSAFEAL